MAKKHGKPKTERVELRVDSERLARWRRHAAPGTLSEFLEAAADKLADYWELRLRLAELNLLAKRLSADIARME